MLLYGRVVVDAGSTGEGGVVMNWASSYAGGGALPPPSETAPAPNAWDVPWETSWRDPASQVTAPTKPMHPPPRTNQMAGFPPGGVSAALPMDAGIGAIEDDDLAAYSDGSSSHTKVNDTLPPQLDAPFDFHDSSRHATVYDTLPPQLDAPFDLRGSSNHVNVNVNATVNDTPPQLDTPFRFQQPLLMGGQTATGLSVPLQPSHWQGNSTTEPLTMRPGDTAPVNNSSSSTRTRSPRKRSGERSVLRITNVPTTVPVARIRSLFSRYGKIQGIEFTFSRKSLGCAVLRCSAPRLHASARFSLPIELLRI